MIRLVPMTAAQFDDYLGPAIAGYAEAHRKAGDADAEEALVLAKADYDSLLPLGIETPNHHLFTIVDGVTSEAVGMLWYEARERRGRKSIYIFDFQVDPRQRGKGYGTAALNEVERMARLQGIGRISLNVMGWNHQAQALYERVGFNVAGIGMTKVLA
jgi:ribosomal protein S18 acetylase RimI-like enzyme